MPQILLDRINTIQQLREETKTRINAALAKWRLIDILNDAGALDELLDQTSEAVTGLAREAVEAGIDSGEAMLRAMELQSHRSDINFQALLDNTISNQVEDARRAASRFTENLQVESQRMASRGMGANEILDLLSRDWELQGKGRIGGQLWRSLERAYSDLMAQVYSIAELAIRNGERVQIRT